VNINSVHPVRHLLPSKKGAEAETTCLRMISIIKNDPGPAEYLLHSSGYWQARGQ
jgi:hypothetical protein